MARRICFPFLLCGLLLMLLTACSLQPNSNTSSGRTGWSTTKYSAAMAKYYEESPDGCLGIFYRIEEIESDRIRRWLDSCHTGANYYEYIEADADAWNLFLYYPYDDRVIQYNRFQFYIENAVVHLYLDNDQQSEPTGQHGYALIRIQASPQGARPESLVLYVDQLFVEQNSNRETAVQQAQAAEEEAAGGEIPVWSVAGPEGDRDRRTSLPIYFARSEGIYAYDEDSDSVALFYPWPEGPFPAWFIPEGRREIYYVSDGEKGTHAANALYKLDLTTETETLLSPDTGMSGGCFFGETLWFYDEAAQSIAKYDTVAEEYEAYRSYDAPYGGSIAVQNGRLYCIAEHLFQLSLNDAGVKDIADRQRTGFCGAFYQNYLFYTDLLQEQEDGDRGCLVRMDLDTYEQILIDVFAVDRVEGLPDDGLDFPDNLLVQEDLVYYSYNGNTYSIDINGENKKRVANFSLSGSLYLRNNKLIWYSPDAQADSGSDGTTASSPLNGYTLQSFDLTSRETKQYAFPYEGNDPEPRKEIEVILEEIQNRLDLLLATEGVLRDAAVNTFLETLESTTLEYLNVNAFNDPECYELLTENDFISQRNTAGGVGYGPNYAALHTALSGRLTAAYDAFLSFQVKYHSDYIVNDRRLRLSWNEVAQYLIDWCSIRARYPVFPYADEVSHTYLESIYTGGILLDNTPFVVENQLAQELRDSYESFLADTTNRNCSSYAYIEALYLVWRENAFEYTTFVSSFIENHN
ncbi:MAG: hypothetical protein FWH28_06660 [Clostridiales bacterium]|nr:hypothetical protein [Clostridiales bacterium]